jgi:hypothetical protein
MPPSRRLVVASVIAAGLALAAAAPSAARTTWLCHPGLKPDPCTPGLATTVYSPTGHVLRVEHPRAVRRPEIDCFYVYPTVSEQSTPLSNFAIEPAETAIAQSQVGRYSQLCRVYAPVYRQLTLTGIFNTSGLTPAQAALPLADVRAAFADYLAHDNHGRGFVLIGHSQGSFLLRGLIAHDIDPKPALRRRLLSAILLGGNVDVPAGRGVGGDFKHIPACRSKTQLGCVTAWSTFDTPVLPDSLFGRTATPGQAVLCTNPAALAGGSGILNPIVPGRPFAPGSSIALGIVLPGVTQTPASTPWVAQPGAYSGACSSAGGGNVLQVTPRNGAPALRPIPDGRWGLHVFDANIALGNLLAVVQSEAAAYARHRGG